MLGVRSRDVLLPFGGALVGALTGTVASRGLIDDTYITLAYARNLAAHGHWGMTPDITSNAATSPLNVLLLAGSFRVVEPFAGYDGELALAVLTTVLGALAAVFLGQYCRRAGLSSGWALGALVVVLANPMLISALGLEVVLVFTVLAALLAAGVTGRAGWFGVAAAAGLVARLDMIVFIAVLALICGGVRRRLHVAIATCCAAGLPWFAVSWWWLGSAIPDTFVIKTNQRDFGPGRTYFRGLWTHYVPDFAVAVAVSVAAAAIGVVVLLLLLRRFRRPEVAGLIGVGLGGAAYFVTYGFLGVPPYQWYYVPPLAALSVVAVLGLGLLTRSRVVGVLLPAAAIAGLGFSVPSAAWPLPWAYPPVFANFATPAQYREIGAEVGRIVGDERVAAPGEIGTLAYACDCELVDQFSDPAIVQGVIDARIAESGPVLGKLLEWNYARREVTPAQPTPWVLRWRSAAVPPPEGVRSWTTTAGTWQRVDELVLFRQE